MRLKLDEAVKAYNERNGTTETLSSMALKVWPDGRIPQTKINRMSALNTGRTIARITDLRDLMAVLNCGCADLVDFSPVIEWELDEKYEAHGPGFYSASFKGVDRDGNQYSASGAWMDDGSVGGSIEEIEDIVKIS